MNLVRRRFSPLLLAAAMAACDSPATVEPDATLAVAPANPVVVFGDSVQVRAVFRDAAGTPLPPRSVTWSSSAPEIISVSQTGLLTGRGWGTARITATEGGQTAWVDATVGPRPPAVAGIALSSSRLNVDAADATLHFLVTVQADRGVAALDMAVEATRRGVSAPQSHACSAPVTPASGTSRAGTWRCTIQLPRASAAGTWNLKSVSVTDSLGKTTTHHENQLIGIGLAAAGLARSFQVESANEDLTPPVPKSLVVRPGTLKAGTAARVELTFSAADAGTGLLRGSASLGTGPWNPFTSCGSTPWEGEGAQAATFTCSILLGSSASGAWPIQIELVDRARNRWVFSSAQLQATGFPHEIPVTP